MTNELSQRHSRSIIAIHWITAVLMIILVAFGEEMAESRGDGANSLFGVHVAMGITILALTVLRILIRLGIEAPALPADSHGWERTVAHTMSAFFYIALLVLPLSGWLAASAGSRYAESGIPMMLGLTLPSLPTGVDRTLHETGQVIHEVGSKIMIPAIVLHVLAALKHHFFSRNAVLTRMLPRWAGGR